MKCHGSKISSGCPAPRACGIARCKSRNAYHGCGICWLNLQGCGALWQDNGNRSSVRTERRQAAVTLRNPSRHVGNTEAGRALLGVPATAFGQPIIKAARSERKVCGNAHHAICSAERAVSTPAGIWQPANYLQRSGRGGELNCPHVLTSAPSWRCCRLLRTCGGKAPPLGRAAGQTRLVPPPRLLPLPRRSFPPLPSCRQAPLPACPATAAGDRALPGPQHQVSQRPWQASRRSSTCGSSTLRPCSTRRCRRIS